MKGPSTWVLELARAVLKWYDVTDGPYVQELEKVRAWAEVMTRDA